MKNTLSANVPNINFDQKQRINLSMRALDVLALDSAAFCNGMNRTGFINELLRRCTGSSDASIDLSVLAYKENLTDILKTKLCHAEADSSVLQKAILALSDAYKTDLTEKALSWPKGESILFRLSNDNCRAFYGNYGEDPIYPTPVCFKGKVARYLKAIIEGYASHTLYERESLFFHDEISLLRMAIKSEKLLRVYSVGPVKKNTWDVRIYDILADDSGLYHYIVGMVAPASAKKSEEHIASLRLSRIQKIHILDSKTSRSGHITSTEKREIETKIEKNRVQFLASDQDDIIVRFNEKGKSTFNQILYMRPKVDFIDNDGLYHFSCSRLQAEYYFERFGADVEILQPKELREKFTKTYDQAHQIYGDPENPPD